MVVRACWSLLFLLGASCATVHRYECELHGGKPSVRLDSEHFSVVSDLKPDDVRFEVRRLERLWDAFAVYFQAAPAPTARLQVLLTREVVAGEFIPHTAGFVAGDLELLMVTTAGRQNTNAHELVHVIVSRWLPSQARWLNEGLAEYLGDAQFKSEYVVRFGRWQWGGGAVDPLETLWSWERSHYSPEETRRRYESSWAWVHYLSNKEETRLLQVWAKMAKGQPAREAFDQVFPPAEQDALHQRVQAYLNAGRFSGWESTLTRDHVLSDATPLAPWEVHLFRHRLFATTGWKEKRQQESALAQGLAPKPEPQAVSVARALDEVYGPERFDRLLAASSEKPGYELRLEQALSDSISPFKRVAVLRELAKERPDDLRTQFELARGLVRVEDGEALAAAKRAVELAPWSPEARLVEVEALEKAHQCVAALASLDAARGLLVERRSGASARIDRIRGRLRVSCEEVKP